MPPTVSEKISEFASANGAKYIFGVPGYANYGTFLSTQKFQDLDVVLTRHEGAAAWMACGYAQVNKRLGVCTGTSGAGTTNLLSGVAAAYANSIPVLVLTGQVETAKYGKGAFQELTGLGPRGISAVKLLSQMTKLSVEVMRPEELSSILSLASTALWEGRPGPVHLSLPLDVQGKTVDDFEVPIYTPRVAHPKSEYAGALKQFLSQAKNPLLLIGRGCRENRQAVRDFAQSLGVPYCTTLQAKDLALADDPFYLGNIGIAGSLRANAFYTNYCDSLVVLGSSLSEFTTLSFHPALSRARIFRVDIDTPSLESDVFIKCDVSDFIASQARYGQNPRSFNLPQEVQETPVHSPVKRLDESSKISPMEIIEVLRESCPPDTIFTADSGNNAVWAVHYLDLLPQQDFLIDMNTGCMGSGVISAIGAKLAAPHRPVVAICGDGGFLMNGVEVSTAAELGLAIVWVVFNDKKLGMVAQGAENKFGASVGTTFKIGEIDAMARGLGVESVRVSAYKDFSSALAKALRSNATTVIDVHFNDLYLPEVYSRAQRDNPLQSQGFVD